MQGLSHAHEYSHQHNQETRHLQDPQKASDAYVEQCKVAKQAKAALAILNAATSKGEKTSKKASQNTKEGLALADAPDPELRADYQADYEKAKFAAETAKNKRKVAATEMFQFYANLLSADAKYTWNKILKEQMEADPFKDLQGIFRKVPRGLLHESFNNCVMFHLLTVFPNNVAKQEQFYLSNVLKKPQQVGICQLVQRVEQLNAYFAQLPCWYYSLSYNPGMTPVNVPFSKADLAVTFSGCVRISGRISTTSTKRGGLLRTCVCFRCLLRQLSTCVCRNRTMRNLARDKKVEL
jgi:hypothetical protein